MSSISPIFLLWAIRGTDLMDQLVFALVCIVLFLLFNVCWLAIALEIVTDRSEVEPIEVDSSEDRRQDVIAYLFAMLLPFYASDFDSVRSLILTIAALLVVIILFWGLNLHYLNLWLVLLGYHCLHVTSPDNENTRSSAASFMVVTRKPFLRAGETYEAHRISSSVMVLREPKDEE
jgi:hypothetical protein